jgi:predicted phosphate transport protein (TIGR00153 family)
MGGDRIKDFRQFRKKGGAMPFWMPREEKFFDMFDETAEIVGRAAQRFLDMMTNFDRLEEREEELKADEHAGDLVVERIIRALDRSFVTPFDREDIHRLATSLDDVLDNMEETAYRLMAFRVDKPTAQAVEMARIIHECAGHVARAVRLVRTLKEPDQMEISLREIGRLENEADRIYREVEGNLFKNPPDLLTLIKWRELYGWLEETVDACRAVAQVISEIVIKGS